MSPVGHGIHPGLTRPRVDQGGPAPDMPQNKGLTKGYRLETFLNDPNADPFFEQIFEGEGSHIFLQELNGSDTIYVRLDTTNSHWVEMEEGDTIVRTFDRFWVRSNSRFLIFPTQAQVRARFVVSNGPMILRAPKKYGFREGFYTTGGTATAGGVDAFAAIAAQYATTEVPAVMKFGGTLIIDNRDTANDMFAYLGIAGSFAPAGAVYPNKLTALRIPPNQSIALVFENRIVNRMQPNNADIPGHTLVLACDTALTAVFAVTVSRLVVDYADPESVVAGKPGLKEL